ncbi:MAG: hypothetical protein WCE90_07170 [Candidatus Zixiibacteriota bacterium]
MIRSWIVILLAAGFLFTVGGCSKDKQEVAKKETPEVAKNETQEAPDKNIPEAPKQETQVASKKETQNTPKKAKVPTEPKEEKLTVPGSTQLFVTLSDTVQTNKNQTGDRFTGTLTQPVEVGGNTAFPAGTKVNLVITKLVKGGTLKTPPEIAFTVESITSPDGKSYPVSANEFYQKGRSHTDREVGMIGGGAAAGAIIGGLTKKGKGAAVGAAIGAAAGTGVAAATGRQNLVFAPGQSVSFTLTQPLAVTVPRK